MMAIDGISREPCADCTEDEAKAAAESIADYSLYYVSFELSPIMCTYPDAGYVGISSTEKCTAYFFFAVCEGLGVVRR